MPEFAGRLTNLGNGRAKAAESYEMRSMKVEDDEVGSRQTEKRDVTLADGTKIRKQMPDFKDKDTS